jgi:hypothetical protein
MFDRIRALASSFDRLSTREKGLIVGMVSLFVGLILFFVILAVSSSLSDLADEVQAGRAALKEIYALSDDYRENTVKRAQMQKLIDENPITSLRIPVNAIAKGITAQSSEPGYQGNGKRLADLVSYGGKTVETRLEPKSKKPRARTRKDKGEEGGNFEIEQSMEFTDLPLLSLYELLEALKHSSDLIFVRRLEIGRRFNNLEHVRATLSVSTIRYREPEAQ